MLEPDETWHLPAQIYVAVRPDRASAGPMFELRTFGPDERPVALAYSSLDAFLDGCGADQPWVLLPAERLADFAQTADGRYKFSVVVDRSVPPPLRGTAGGMATDEPNWADDDSADWDPVYIPSRPFDKGQERAYLELQPMPGGHLALMAYSSQATLVAGCGSHQPWVSLPAGLLSEARSQAGANTICLDTPLPDHLRHIQGRKD